jgi:hypothetical protein
MTYSNLYAIGQYVCNTLTFGRGAGLKGVTVYDPRRVNDNLQDLANSNEG